MEDVRCGAVRGADDDPVTIGQQPVHRRGLIARGIALGLGCAAPTLGWVPRAAARDTYPDRPIRIVIPAPPGGPSDVLLRLIRPSLEERFRQTLVVDNRSSSGGMVGMGAVARTAPDGYTLVLATSVMVINPSLFQTSSFDPEQDFAPIAELATAPNIFLARSDSAMHSLADVLATAWAHPGTLNYASPGIGTTPHLAVELLKVQASLDITHIPFLGVNPAIAALLNGTTELAALALPPALPQLKDGAMRGLAVTGAARWPDLPDVPTVAESGLPSFRSETFQALLAPRGTPSAIIEQWEEAVSAAVRAPQLQPRLRQLGFNVFPRGPETLRARISEEVGTYRQLILQAGIRAE